MIIKENKKSLIAFIPVFFLVNLFLTGFYTDLWLSPNATSRALPVLTWYENKSLAIDKYEAYTLDKSKVGEHFYSDKAPVATFLTIPLYSLYKSTGWNDVADSSFLLKYPLYMYDTRGTPDSRTFFGGFWPVKDAERISTILFLGGFVSGTLPFVISILLTFIFIRKSNSSFSPVIVAMLSFYASYLFVNSGVFIGHILTGMLVLLTYLLLKEKKLFLAAGLTGGLAFATEYPVAVIMGIWTLQVWLNEKSVKKTMLFAAGLIPGIALILIYNNSITGNAFTTLYSYVANPEFEKSSNIGFGMPKLDALWGLTFSRYRGILFYTPLLYLMLFYFIKNNLNSVSKFFNYEKTSFFISWSKNYFLVPFICYLILISSNQLWWGGWAYGPRHLVPIAFLALYEGCYLLSKINFSKYLFMIIGFAGLLVSWMAKATRLYMVDDHPVQFGNPIFNIVIPDFMKDKFNSNNVLSIFFDTAPKTANYLWLILFVICTVALSVWHEKINPVLKTAKQAAVVKNVQRQKTKTRR